MLLRKARSMKGLLRLLDEVETGRGPKPDWIDLESACRLDRVALPEREALVARLHRCVMRGFRARNVSLGRASERVEYWRSVARNGFHDFSEDGWTKCYDSPFVQDYDYLCAYLERGLEALDPYLVYSSVLGTHDFGVEDFTAAEACEGVDTVVEPMAGSAELSYLGHFRHPEFRYVMFDLDPEAQAHVQSRPWLPDVEPNYVIADVLDEEIWKQVRSLTGRRSLCYIGKQSHHFFRARELHRLMRMACAHVDYFVLEVPEPSIITDLESEDELTRDEMEDAGFHVCLVDEPYHEPNPLTNRMNFRLDVWDQSGRRTLFPYHDWTSWQHPTLVALAHMLELRATYFDATLGEFVPVEELRDVDDVLDNVSFLMFTRHR